MFISEISELKIQEAKKTVKELKLPDKNGEFRAPNGCTIYWKFDDAVGCRQYYSDEVGGGINVWHTALVDSSTLLACITKEMEFQKLEHVIVEREKLQNNVGDKIESHLVDDIDFDQMAKMF